jgi:hypothetical protein
MMKSSPASPTGSSVTPIYSNREMEFVSISKGEIDNISSETTQATVFFTLSSFVASAAVGIYTNAAFYDKVTPTGEIAIGVAAPVLLAIAAAFAIIGLMHVRSRRKIWTRITKEAGKP